MLFCFPQERVLLVVVVVTRKQDSSDMDPHQGHHNAGAEQG